ncbi:pantoate--beta-alanine ligase [Bowdeniella nasicola]
MSVTASATPLRIAVIGSGRVGPVLAAAFRQAGHRIVGITARSEAAADRIGAVLPDVPVRNLHDIADGADLILIAVSDNALPTVAEELAVTPGQIVVHTSGAHGLSVLSPLAQRGAITMAIHPAMTFTGTSLDLARLADCAFAVTAAPGILPVAHALVSDVGGQPVSIADADRPLYHAALTHAANHSVTLIAQARRMLTAIGQVDPGTTLKALVRAAIEGALRSGDSALTGPVMRGDTGTIRAHLAVLADLGEADIATTYRTLALMTAQRCADRELLDADQLAELTSALKPAMEVARTKADLKAALALRPGRRAVVMTMGALHEGHLTLVRKAKELADVVAVTDFVNPLQFAPNEDFDAYPRDLEADVALLADEGVDVVFAPSSDEMYPRDPLVRIDPGPVATMFEGVTRPTHFAGVLQVVTKLLMLTQPDIAIFGEKDAQQLALIRTLVDDLDIPVEIIGAPIARDDDGVARSSRNAYLSEAERAQARALVAALDAAEAAAASGEARDAAAVADVARASLAEAEGVRVDYVAAVDAGTYLPADAATSEIILALAAFVGPTRLIDNRRMTLGTEEDS